MSRPTDSEQGRPAEQAAGTRVGARVVLALAAVALGAPALAQEQGPQEAPAEVDAAEYFADLDRQLELTVVAASQQEEPLRETPVPVTVITREMLRAVGARTLQDALLAWVPGVTLVADHNEMNVAMRGVYASAQQKVLVLRDGHRLNSRAYSAAALDYGIGLDGVERIEVLRGPGSSLYGNVALTAVVNIVSRTGADVDGAQVRVGAGDHGQRTAGLVVGKGLGEKGDVLLWGTVYEAEGERVEVPAASNYSAVDAPGTALLGAVRGPPSHDVGMNLRLGDFRLLASSRYGKYTEPFTAAGVTGEAYDHDRYRRLLGDSPGIGSASNHLELRWGHAFGEAVDVALSATYDTNRIGAVTTTDARGGVVSLNWNEDVLGASAQLRHHYLLGALGSGTVTAGLQLEQMRLLDSLYLAGSNYEFTTVVDRSDKPLLEPGRELVTSGYVQAKHQLLDALILNVGLRYDTKDRHRGANITNLSPRLAFIWAPERRFDVKLSYAQSFVDAPYWYRYNALPSYRGAASLTPEQLRSLQLTPTVHLLDGKLTSTLNVFYNHLFDFVFRNNQATADQPIYQNAGVLRTLGVEEELALVQDAWRLRAHATWQRVLEGRDYGTSGADIFNVPSLVATGVAELDPLAAAGLEPNRLWLTAQVRYVGAQRSPISIRFTDATGAVVREFQEPEHRVPAAVVTDLTARLRDVGVDGLSVEASVYNLFDTRYAQGGSVQHPYPQPGRWFLVNLLYQLPL